MSTLFAVCLGSDTKYLLRVYIKEDVMTTSQIGNLRQRKIKQCSKTALPILNDGVLELNAADSLLPSSWKLIESESEPQIIQSNLGLCKMLSQNTVSSLLHASFLTGKKERAKTVYEKGRRINFHVSYLTVCNLM